MKTMTGRWTRRRCAVALGSFGLGAALLLSVPALAQGGPGGGGRMNPQTQVDAMTDQLGLTAEQQPKVLAILQESQKKMMEIRNSGGDPEEMRPKMMALREDQQTKIKAVLTDEQRVKYDAMIKAQQERMRNGGGPPPPPPQ
ncbi:MAG: hypothetical protein M3O02_03825 [Acidobacteriota bacterium]|nr:hypothetical protein [Acidobacteriota bacterium]